MKHYLMKMFGITLFTLGIGTALLSWSHLRLPLAGTNAQWEEVIARALPLLAYCIAATILGSAGLIVWAIGMTAREASEQSDVET